MSIIDGQRVRALESNAAWASKTNDNTLAGKLTLSRTGSGSTITDVQQSLNTVITQLNGLSVASGFGASLNWVESLNAPVSSVLSNMQVYEFEAGLDQSLYALIKVPQSYPFGFQIKLKIAFFSNDSSGTALIQSVSNLIRPGAEPYSVNTNQRTSTNSAITLNAGNQTFPQVIELDLTSTTGQINGVSLDAASNHLINVQIKRGTDTSTSSLFLIPNSAEVIIS